LRVRSLSVQTPLGSVEDVSFDVHVGECVGLFGLRGSGTAAIADAVAGLVKPSDGDIELDGAALQAGTRTLPSSAESATSRRTVNARGFVPTLGVAENLTLPILERLSSWGIVSGARRDSVANGLVRRLEIVTSGGDQLVAELSGGNQQKVVVGRALAGSRLSSSS